MKNFMKLSICFSALLTLSAFAETTLKKLTINYSRLLLPVDRQGFAIPQAIVGGKVDFEGDLPVFVTMLVGGQSYTQATDRAGFFSFMVYTAGASEYTLEAWTAVHGATGQETVKLTVVQQPIGVNPIK